jgi:hypothetical protein
MSGAFVTYKVSVSPSVSDAGVYCLPASGSFFPIGKTAVSCIAIDKAGNAIKGSFASFTVIVNY